MKCSSCLGDLESSWSFCPSCATATGRGEVSQLKALTDAEIDAVFEGTLGWTPLPPGVGKLKRSGSTSGTGGFGFGLPSASQQLGDVREALVKLVKDVEQADVRSRLDKIVSELDSVADEVSKLEQTTAAGANDSRLQMDLERELQRSKQAYKPKDL